MHSNRFVVFAIRPVQLGMVVMFCLYSATTSAGWININTPGANAMLYIGIGVATTDATQTVTFAPATIQVGTPVTGAPTIQIEYYVQRASSTNITGTLKANAANLTSGANSINISDISWTSAAITGAGPGAPPGGTVMIPSGSFVVGSQNLHSLTTTTGTAVSAGAIFTFVFTPSQNYPAGTYTGTVNYTVTVL